MMSRKLTIPHSNVVINGDHRHQELSPSFIPLLLPVTVVIPRPLRIPHTATHTAHACYTPGAPELKGSHYIGKERHHEVSSHLGWHQELEHPQRAHRPAGQTDCRVQRSLHSHCGVRAPQVQPFRAWRFISGQEPETPM